MLYIFQKRIQHPQPLITERLTHQKLPALSAGGRTQLKLDQGGQLFLEHDIPCLLIYRKRLRDKEVVRLARTGSSYLIMGDGSSYFKELLDEITDKMSKRFGAFLLIEIYGGNQTEFKIQATTPKLPKFIQSLKNDLGRIDSRRYFSKLTAHIEHDLHCGPKDKPSLLDSKRLRKMGGTLIGISIPQAYKDEKQIFYPLYFKYFRTHFAKALQEAAFEFIRIQTTSKIASYHALGRRQIHDEVLEIDRKITSIQNSYSFLMLVAPVNIKDLKERFFKSNCTQIEKYHYRLLPVDPDILKRRLYNLDIDKIDDPALSYIYDEKREEIDQELTMLKERGSANFFYSSVRMFQTVPTELHREAIAILENNQEAEVNPNSLTLSAVDFKNLAQKEFGYFKNQSADFKSKVHIQKDLNIMMVSNGALHLPENYRLSAIEAQALIQHEIGTHVLTYYNGSRQPLKQLASGLAGYDALQEGLAVLAEYLANALSSNRLRTLAGRVVAGVALQNGASFVEMYTELTTTYHFAQERAFDITSRMFQGGGFMKDVVYLKGLLELRSFLGEGGKLEALLSGKFALKHLATIKDLTERGLLLPAAIKPRYLEDTTLEKRLNEFAAGLPLHKMAIQ